MWQGPGLLFLWIPDQHFVGCAVVGGILQRLSLTRRPSPHDLHAYTPLSQQKFLEERCRPLMKYPCQMPGWVPTSRPTQGKLSADACRGQTLHDSRFPYSGIMVPVLQFDRNLAAKRNPCKEYIGAVDQCFCSKLRFFFSSPSSFFCVYLWVNARLYLPQTPLVWFQASLGGQESKTSDAMMSLVGRRLGRKCNPELASVCRFAPKFLFSPLVSFHLAFVRVCLAVEL